MNYVNLYECETYENSNDIIIKLINDFPILKNIKNGQKVVIKANLVSALAPEKGATTNYLLIKYLTRYLTNKGASVLIGDSPGGLYNAAHLNNVYKITKMNLTGAKLNDNFNVKNVINENTKVLKTFDYTEYLDDADIKINFCKLKSHAMMGMSACTKNLFGTIPGLTKSEYHYRFPNHTDFANMLIDLNEYFKFDINIVDAIIGMDGNGPTMGNPKKIGLILASTNPYALDYICSKIINLDPKCVETVKESLKRNLFNVDNIILNNDYQKYIVKDFNNIKSNIDIRFFDNSLKGYFLKKILDNKPYCKNAKCIHCKKCIDICPQKAIKIINNKIIIDRKKCIKCYCCQEFCVVGAMQVKKSIISKLLTKKKGM